MGPNAQDAARALEDMADAARDLAAAIRAAGSDETRLYPWAPALQDSRTRIARGTKVFSAWVDGFLNRFQRELGAWRLT